MVEQQQIITRQLSSGDRLTIPSYHFRGSEAGAPSLYLQAAIHGAETQGYWVALKLIEFFSRQAPKGDVTIVPLANPYGVNNKMVETTCGRFDPITGANWNRNYADLAPMLAVDDFVKQYAEHDFAALIPLFKKRLLEETESLRQQPQAYAKKLNLQLQQLACQADIVLDLHCDTQSQPHVYSAIYAEASAVKLNFPYVVTISPQFAGALDEAIFCPWWQLTRAFNAFHGEQSMDRPPIEVFTVELGHQEMIDQRAAEYHVAALLSYFNHTGVCEAKTLESRSVTTATLDNFVTLYAPTGGLIVEVAPLGKPVASNEALMKISNPQTLSTLEDYSHCSESSCTIISHAQRCIPITHIDSSNVHEGMAVMKVIQL
ncbi:MAG: succinylglutamate desuccinylase/aspartoacylase family protein [Gammaproteobacteria bacterium]|nr:succinylglutamate desuccinylase/aspartoacylase family protein [Gammaproteobacteria bacterium]